jgi:uncharacterized short protein YbdD (DUF466 family)
MHISDNDMANNYINISGSGKLYCLYLKINKMKNSNGMLDLVLITLGLLVGVVVYNNYLTNQKHQPASPVDVSSQSMIQPSVMSISAAQYKDTVKYPESGTTLRTITVESFIQDEDGNTYIKEENGPHFTLGPDTNLDESSVGSTFDCMLQHDESGFTSGITMGKCSQR